MIQYITWVSDNKVAWTLNAPGLGPDPTVAISARPVPQEPLVRHFSPPFLSLTSLSCDKVYHHQPWNVKEFRCYRFCTSNLSQPPTHRLYSCLPRSEQRQHWMQPQGFPNFCLHKRVGSEIPLPRTSLINILTGTSRLIRTQI